MGFSVKLAPGVRVRASSRGVRTSIGPRAARVHVGAGRTGFSTGAGPVGYYTSVSGPSRRSGTTSSGTTNRQLATASQVEKAEQAQQLADALSAVLDLPRTTFPDAQRPLAPAPPAVDLAAFRHRHQAEAKASTSVFSRAARRAALEEADRRAKADARALEDQYAAQRLAWQQALDTQWQALMSNAEDEVLASLAEAFEDNEAAAAAVGLHGDEVSLVVLVPAESALPERRPTTTAAGNLSLKKLTKREAADLYKLVVCGHALVTVKEAFAVAPGLRAARVVAMRAAAPDAYGNTRPEVMLAARLERSSLHGIRWDDADAVQIVNDAATEVVMRQQKGATAALAPVDLTGEPDLAALLDAVDFEELLEK